MTVSEPVGTPASEAVCNCDGASCYLADENRRRHPFIVNASCQVHGAAVVVPTNTEEKP